MFGSEPAAPSDSLFFGRRVQIYLLTYFTCSRSPAPLTSIFSLASTTRGDNSILSSYNFFASRQHQTFSWPTDEQIFVLLEPCFVVFNLTFIQRFASKTSAIGNPPDDWLDGRDVTTVSPTVWPVMMMMLY